MKIISITTKGFTLIETLVAITILMISIAGPLTIASKGLIAAVGSRDQVIASYLAQDLMEYIKNTRDGYVLADPSNNWNTTGAFLTKYASTYPCISVAGCGIETAPGGTQGNVFSCSLLSNCRLSIDKTNNYYTYTTSSNTTATQFYRYFTFTPKTINGGLTDVVLVTVTVKWMNGTIPNSVVLKAILLNAPR